MTGLVRDRNLFLHGKNWEMQTDLFTLGAMSDEVFTHKHEPRSIITNLGIFGARVASAGNKTVLV